MNKVNLIRPWRLQPRLQQLRLAPLHPAGAPGGPQYGHPEPIAFNRSQCLPHHRPPAGGPA